jgi:hypothetical protein
MLLAGIGHVDNQQKKNFLIVDASQCLSHGYTVSVTALTLGRDANERDRVCIPGLHREEGYRDLVDQSARMYRILPPTADRERSP